MRIPTLPTLQALLDQYTPPAPRPRLVLLTHLLPTALAYVRALARVFDVTVVAIPYSAVPAAVRALQLGGISVVVPREVEDVAPVTLEIVARQAEAGPVVVQEIGGYLAAHGAVLSAMPNLLGIVEDTINGHWRYHTHHESLRFPVLSIARSPIKGIEDSLVGDAIVFSVERLLRHSFFRVLKGADALVIGFGSIGSSCADALRRRGARTAVFDTDPVKLMQATVQGYVTGERNLLLGRADVIIGATGRCSIDVDAARQIRNGAVVASGSSRQVEVDIAGMNSAFSRVRLSSSVDMYRHERRQFYLLAQGCPVNFRDCSVLGQILDGIYSELFLCIREIACGRVDVGLHQTTSPLHNEVAQAWCKAYLPRGEKRRRKIRMFTGVGQYEGGHALAVEP